MAITIIQKAKRKKIILIVGVAIIIIALLLISYLTFIKPSEKSPVESEQTITSTLSQKLKRLEVKWDLLEDIRLEEMESFPDASSIEIEESGRENPFLPY